MFKKKPQSAQQKAQRYQLRLFVRVACCGYIIFYVILPLIRTSPDESDSLSPTMKSVIIIAFSVITAAFLVVTTIEFIRNWKAGNFKATAYADDEEFVGNLESGENSESEENAESGIRNNENAESGIRNSEYKENSESDDGDDEDDEDYEDTDAGNDDM